MQSRNRFRRPAHPTIVAYLALFVALGGTGAWAAGEILVTSSDVKKNAIRAKHIKKQQIRGKHVKKESLKGSKLKPDSVTGKQVRESKLDAVPGATLARYAFDAGALGGKAAGQYIRNGSAAGGALTGSYPNPQLAPLGITDIDGLQAALDGLDGDVTSLNSSLNSLDSDNIASLPLGKARQTSTQSVAAGGAKLNLDTVDLTQDVAFSDANDTLTVQKAGVYQVAGHVNWGVAGGVLSLLGTQELELQKNGAPALSEVLSVFSGVSATSTSQDVSGLVSLDAGDEVSLRASGLDLTTSLVDGTGAGLSLVWVAPKPS